MNKKFFEALMKGLERNRSNYDTKKLEQLVKSSDPNDKETLNSTIVDILESDDTVAFEFLMANQGINVYSKDYDGKTPLSIAASVGSIKIVKLLLGQMKAAEVKKYNQEYLLQLEFPKILPDLWLTEDVIAIVNLFIKKKIQLTLQHKLAVLKFLVHSANDCDCGNTELNTRELEKNLEVLGSYGSAVHVKTIIDKITAQIEAKEIKMDELDLQLYAGRPLSPITLLGLYADTEVKNIASDWEDGYPMKQHHADEIKWLKAHKVQKNGRLSLYKVLTMNPRETYQHISKLDFHKLAKKYNCAGEYMKGLKAKSLIWHQVEEFLPDFIRALYPPMPDRCFDKIHHYLRKLDNEDILKMCQVAVAKEEIVKV